MGSSAKKKKEKKKDFQKVKLKVGKAKPKAENQTDTAFRSKAIVLNQQSLNIAAPTSTTLFSHHLSMLSARSDSQRKESLAYLTTFVATHPVDLSLPQPVGSLLTKTCPLVLDGSSTVRQQLFKFFQVLPSEEIRDHVIKILPFVRAGMTHLSREIRGSAIDMLSWLLKVAGVEVVSCTGGWQKTLESFTTLLGWRTLEDSSKWSTSKASFNNESKTIARVMQVLDQFLRAGLEVAENDESLEEELIRSSFPTWHTVNNQISTKSNAFAHLNLFGSRPTDGTLLLEDREDRLAVFNEHFRASVTNGVDAARQEGGEPGRAAGLLLKTLKQNSSME